MKKAISTGDGWFKVLTRKEKKQRAARQAATYGYARLHRNGDLQGRQSYGNFTGRNPFHASTQQRKENFPRQNAFNAGQFHQKTCFFPRKYSQVQQRQGTGKFSNGTHKDNNAKLYVNGIKNSSTVADLFPRLSPQAFKAINGAPRQTTSTKTHSPYRLSLTPNSFIQSSSEHLMANNNNKNTNTNLMQPTFNAHITPPSNRLAPQGLSYAQLVGQNPQQPFAFSSQRFQSPPWPHFIDQCPWPLNPDTLNSPTTPQAPQNIHPQLPMPPNPAHYLWRNRCYNCLELGHDQKGCKSDK